VWKQTNVERERERQTDRDTDRQRERDREREREREREAGTNIGFSYRTTQWVRSLQATCHISIPLWCVRKGRNVNDSELKYTKSWEAERGTFFCM
jgi:hypothetical protein